MPLAGGEPPSLGIPNASPSAGLTPMGCSFDAVGGGVTSLLLVLAF